MSGLIAELTAECWLICDARISAWRKCDVELKLTTTCRCFVNSIHVLSPDLAGCFDDELELSLLIILAEKIPDHV